MFHAKNNNSNSIPVKNKYKVNYIRNKDEISEIVNYKMLIKISIKI